MAETMTRLPPAAGVGFKPQHFGAVMADPGAVRWLEIHAENYMSAGGRQMAQLAAIAERFAISIHGVGLSIGGDSLDAEHLARVGRLVRALNPASFSEHLAWSSHGGAFFNDLLPLPYTGATLARVCEHIDAVQDALGRRMLLENPSTYLAFAESTWSEVDFLTETLRRTGCGLLLDVNNVFVACTNQATDPRGYLEGIDMAAVGEIHLGGHDSQSDEHGAPLLIDSHGAEVVDPVWQLYREVIAAAGPKPTLIEWDNDVPDWPVLEAEAARAAAILAGASAGLAGASGDLTGASAGLAGASAGTGRAAAVATKTPARTPAESAAKIPAKILAKTPGDGAAPRKAVPA